MKNFNRMIIPFLLISAVLLSRLLPHQPNFTPVISIILFSSMFFRKSYYLVFPLVAILLSDVLLQTYQGYSYLFSNVFFWTYGALFLIFIIFYNYNYTVSAKNVFFNSLLGSILFYIVSNFGVWITSGGFYPYSFSGLISCYMAAIPFFRNTLTSTMIYSLILFAPILLNSRVYLSNKAISSSN